MVSREEAVATMFILGDIAAEVAGFGRSPRRTVKRKRISKERLEEIRREAENHPPIRRLRELAERGEADLEARRRSDAPPRR